MPSTNAVHKAYLEQHGFVMRTLPSSCPDCITVEEFSKMYPKGDYILATGDHVVALRNGIFYDIFDSSDEIVTYFFERRQ